MDVGRRLTSVELSNATGRRKSTDLGGVVGTARSERRQAQLGRPDAAQSETATDPYKREARNRSGPRQESEGFIVAMKRGNSRGAKGPSLFRAGNGRKHGAIVRKDCQRVSLSAAIPGRAAPESQAVNRERLWSRELREPCAGNSHARFDEGEMETESHDHRAISLLYPHFRIS